MAQVDLGPEQLRIHQASGPARGSESRDIKKNVHRRNTAEVKEKKRDRKLLFLRNIQGQHFSVPVIEYVHASSNASSEQRLDNECRKREVLHLKHTFIHNAGLEPVTITTSNL